jgi:glucose-6-phosphate 1-epimerase
MEKFEKHPHITLSNGEEGMDNIILKHESGSTVEVYFKGAHVTNFQTAKKENVIFLSTKAQFKDKPIRGGIPICFPQFGPGDLIQHGFARNVIWKLKETSVINNVVSVTLYITNPQENWKHDFIALYTISLGGPNSFTCDLCVQNLNQNDQDMKFTTALHTYFWVPSIRSTKIFGLKDCKYLDKVVKKELVESRGAIDFDGEKDTVYYSAPNKIRIESQDCVHILETKGFDDIVVWNPWDKPMGDMGKDDWNHMVCVESAQIQNPIILKPKEIWTGSQKITH